MLRVSRRKLPLLAAAIGATLPTLGFSQTWNFNNGNAVSPWTGTWGTAANWNPNSAFPNGITAAVVFPTAMVNSASGTVTLNGLAITVGRLDINPVGTVLNGNSYTLTGAGSLSVIAGGTIQVQSSGTVSAGVATINTTLATPVNSSITKTGLGALFLGGTNNFGGGSSTEFSGLTVASGSVIANSAGALNGLKAISTGGDGQLELRNQTVGTIPNPVIGAVGATVAPVNGSIYASTGSNTWNGNFFLLQNASMGVGTGATLTVNGNVFTDGAGTVGNGLTKVGGGLLNVNNLGLNGTVAANGGTLTIKQTVGAGQVNRTGPITIAGGATPTAALDINNHVIISQVADTAAGLAQHNALMSQLLYANNGFAWDQPGLTSTKVATEIANGNPVGIGLVWNNDGAGNAIFYGNGGDLPQFQGNSVDANSVLVKYTWLGDADLNGVVDANDFGLLQFGYVGGQPYNSWAFGDFDYNGVVDPNDFGLAQFGYVGQGAPLSPELSASILTFANAHDLSVLPEIVASAALVPEPTTLGLLAIGSGALGLRRRRRA